MLSELNQRATLFARTLTPDSGGGFTESWDAFAVVWIALQPRDATDTRSADHMESRIRHVITLRRRNDLAAGQRLTVGPRTFRVHAVLDAHQTLTTLHVEELP